MVINQKDTLKAFPELLTTKYMESKKISRTTTKERRRKGIQETL